MALQTPERADQQGPSLWERTSDPTVARAERDRLARELTAIRASAAWRLAGPLRWLEQRFPRPIRGAVRLFDWVGQVRWFGLQSRRRLSAEAELIASSALFDPAWYVAANPDLALEARAPLEHWLAEGCAEGRDPHPLFAAGWYLAQNPDVRAAGVNPLVHYLQRGAAEGRDPHPLFDTSWYLDQNPDLAGAGLSPLTHYARLGAAEGRDPSAWFKSALRLCLRAEVARQHLDGLLDYLERMERDPGNARHRRYSEWVRRFDSPNRRVKRRLTRQLKATPRQPFLSVIVSVGGESPERVGVCLASIRGQLYENWELYVSTRDAASKAVRRVVEDYSTLDSRIRPVCDAAGLGKAAAENCAVSHATGEYVVLIQSVLALSPLALGEIALATDGEPASDIIYADEDHIQADGRRVRPFFKPDWSPSLYRQRPYLGAVLGIRRTLFDRVGAFDTACEPAHVFDFILRCSEHTDRVGHISKVLYHQFSTSAGVNELDVTVCQPDTIQRSVVEAHLSRMGWKGKACLDDGGRLAIGPRTIGPFPPISVILTARDGLRGALRNARKWQTLHCEVPVEILIPATGASSDEMQSAGDLGRAPFQGNIRAVPTGDLPRSIAAMFNVAASQALGKYLLLIDGAVEPASDDFLERLVFEADQEGVGAVGPRIEDTEGRIYSAGGLLGLDGAVGDCMKGERQDDATYLGLLGCTREVAVLSGRCLLVDKDAFEAVGGYDENFLRMFGGEDLCMRLRQRGPRLLHVPAVVAVAAESRAVPDDDLQIDRALFLDRWEALIEAGDPFYNRNLEIENGRFELAFPPR